MFDESNPRFIYSVTIFLRFVTASRKSRYIIQSVLLFGCVHSIACGGLEFRIGHRTDAAERSGAQAETHQCPEAKARYGLWSLHQKSSGINFLI
jgi:hypothetical protein